MPQQPVVLLVNLRWELKMLFLAASSYRYVAVSWNTYMYEGCETHSSSVCPFSLATSR